MFMIEKEKQKLIQIKQKKSKNTLKFMQDKMCVKEFTDYTNYQKSISFLIKIVEECLE